MNCLLLELSLYYFRTTVDKAQNSKQPWGGSLVFLEKRGRDRSSADTGGAARPGAPRRPADESTGARLTAAPARRAAGVRWALGVGPGIPVEAPSHHKALRARREAARWPSLFCWRRLRARAAARKGEKHGAEGAKRTEPSLLLPGGDSLSVALPRGEAPFGRTGADLRTFLMPEPKVVTGQGLGPFRRDFNKQALQQPQKMNDLMNHWVMEGGGGGVYVNSNLWSKAGLLFLLLQYCVRPPPPAIIPPGH